MDRKEIAHRIKTAENSFAKIFESMQMCGYYCLYIDIDEEYQIIGENFSERKIKNFNRFLVEMNDDLNNGAKLDEIKAKIMKNLNIDTLDLAKRIPLRSRLKIVNMKKFKYPDVIMRNTNEGIEVFLILAIEVLHTHYGFSARRILVWWDNVVKFSKLYAEGFKDSHMIEYFKQACGFDLTY